MGQIFQGNSSQSVVWLSNCYPDSAQPSMKVVRTREIKLRNHELVSYHLNLEHLAQNAASSLQRVDFVMIQQVKALCTTGCFVNSPWPIICFLLASSSNLVLCHWKKKLYALIGLLGMSFGFFEALLDLEGFDLFLVVSDEEDACAAAAALAAVLRDAGGGFFRDCLVSFGFFEALRDLEGFFLLVVDEEEASAAAAAAILWGAGGGFFWNCFVVPCTDEDCAAAPEKLEAKDGGDKVDAQGFPPPAKPSWSTSGTPSA